MSRYARQMVLPEIGAEGQKRLGKANVLVVGAGGLAASALPALAGAGVGRMTIVDGDRVEQSNLHRQTLFTDADIGHPKAEVAAARCRSLNHEVGVQTRRHVLTPENAEMLVDAHDLILDCADSYAASYTLSDTCAATATPLVSASVLGLSGYVGGFCGTAPSLRAVFPDAPPQNAANCATAGVMGPVVAILGAIQAQMALSALLGLEPSALGQVLTVDMGTYRLSGFRFDGAAEPATSFPFIARADIAEGDVIVELRGEEEAPTPIHAAAQRLSVDNLQRLTPDTRRLVLACASGLRAWRAAERVKDTWPGEIVLVAAKAS